MNGKRDKMEEALDAFWGNKIKEEVPQTITVGIAKEVESPQEAYKEYEEEGTTIKEQIESDVNATQDMRPGISQKPAAKPKNLYDLAGLDAMIQGQLAKERGFASMGLGIGLEQKKMSPEQKQYKELNEFRIKSLKEKDLLARREQRLALQEFARQSRSRSQIESGIAQKFRQSANVERFAAGLPVYESALDVLAGGKRKVAKYENVPIKDAAGNVIGSRKVEVGQSIERYGGIFGGAGEVYKGAKIVAHEVNKATPYIKSGFSNAKSNLKGFFDRGEVNKVINNMNEELYKPKKENFVTSVPLDYGKDIASAVSRIEHEKPERKLFHYDDKTASSINSAMEEMNKPLKSTKTDLRSVK